MVCIASIGRMYAVVKFWSSLSVDGLEGLMIKANALKDI